MGRADFQAPFEAVLLGAKRTGNGLLSPAKRQRAFKAVLYSLSGQGSDRVLADF